MNEYPRNVSLSYVLPMISDKEYNKDLFINNVFKGCYLEHENKENIGGILLVYKYIPSFEYTTFSKKLIDNKYHLYRYMNDGELVYVFKLPEEYMDDFELLCIGKYKDISPELKLRISKFWGNNFVEIKDTLSFDKEIYK